MHLYSAVFILALLAFGGVAAYLGDVLGYRLGKRRFSLLRLRPRTTATLVGVLAGVLIPAVTMIVGYWQIDYVRIALLELDDIQQKLDTLKHERDTLIEQRDRLRQQRNLAQRSAHEARVQAENSQQQLQGVRNGLEAARSHLQAARASVSALRHQTGRLRADRERLKTDLDKTQDTLSAAEAALMAAEASLREVEDAKERLERERVDLTEQVETLRQQYLATRAQVDAIEEEWEDLHSLFSEQYGARRPIFDLGTELVRGVVERPDDLDGLKNEVVALLVLADQAAEAAGAARGDNGRYVRVIGPAPIGVTAQEGEKWPPESRVLGFVVGQLWDATEGSHVVRVIVTRRTFRGEQAHVAFVAQPNHLVFSKGETIVARDLPPRLEQAEVFEQLWLLIADPSRSEVRKQAQAAGMLPDPTTGRYGEVEIRELFRAANECAGRPEPVRVRVEAAADAYTIGPLSITIVVEPSAGGPG